MLLTDRPSPTATANGTYFNCDNQSRLTARWLTAKKLTMDSAAAQNSGKSTARKLGELPAVRTNSAGTIRTEASSSSG